MMKFQLFELFFVNKRKGIKTYENQKRKKNTSKNGGKNTTGKLSQMLKLQSSVVFTCFGQCEDLHISYFA